MVREHQPKRNTKNPPVLEIKEWLESGYKDTQVDKRDMEKNKEKLEQYEKGMNTLEWNHCKKIVIEIKTCKNVTK